MYSGETVERIEALGLLPGRRPHAHVLEAHEAVLGFQIEDGAIPRTSTAKRLA
jgi:hypothetical protein